MSSKPNFLIIGAARCGTTALARYLSQHPDVYLSDPKEPHFLSFADQHVDFHGPGDDVMMNQCVVTDPDAYFSLFARASGHRAIGEGSVSTLYYHERSIEAIQRYVPDSKFIVMLRNPIQRAYSNFLYTTSRGFEPESDFQAALDDETRRVENWHHLWHYTRMGFYCDSLRAFQDAFGADRVKVVLFEAFESDSPAIIRDLYSFLGVDERFVPDTAVVINRSGTARSWPVRVAMHLAHRQPVVKNTLKALVPMRIREQIRNASLAKPPIPVDAAIRLRDVYTEEIHNLGKFLKEDLNHWLATD